MTKEEIELIKRRYDLSEKLVKKVIEVQLEFLEKKEVALNFDEAISFLIQAMNYNKMQVYLIGKELNGEILPLKTTLTKLFELNDNDELLKLYDTVQKNKKKRLEENKNKGLKKV